MTTHDDDALVAYRSLTRTKGAVTLQDIANECGVSRMTVSRALRGDRRFVSEATAARIREAAHQLGYDPARSEGARRLVLGGHDQDILNHAVALYFPDHATTVPYFMRIFNGIITALHAHEMALVTNLVMKPEPASAAQLPRVIRRGDVDGALVYCNPVPFMPTLTALRAEPNFADRPVVSLLNPMPGCSVVMTDDWTGAFEATTHLLALGHRRILHFYGAWDTSYPHQQRLGGMRQACEVAGLDPAAVFAVTRWDYDAPAPSGQDLRAYLASHRDITAILALNDPVAVEVWRALAEFGLRVPEDISLVGFDDSDPLPATNGDNLLTTVAVPLEALGSHAAEQLVEQVHGQAAPQQKLVLPTTLRVRQTTGPVR